MKEMMPSGVNLHEAITGIEKYSAISEDKFTRS